PGLSLFLQIFLSYGHWQLSFWMPFLLFPIFHLFSFSQSLDAHKRQGSLPFYNFHLQTAGILYPSLAAYLPEKSCTCFSASCQLLPVSSMLSACGQNLNCLRRCCCNSTHLMFYRLLCFRSAH